MEAVDKSYKAKSWKEFTTTISKIKLQEKEDGISYVVSGSLALVGGLIGESISNDPVEKGIFVAFQSIGTASVGFGAFKWKIGEEPSLMFESLKRSKNLSPKAKVEFLNNYYLTKKRRQKRAKKIKAITHGIVAALNFANASKQNDDSVKDLLNFIGAVNVLATASYTFEF